MNNVFGKFDDFCERFDNFCERFDNFVSSIEEPECYDNPCWYDEYDDLEVMQ